MAALPQWTHDRMSRLGVIVERYGRTTRGRPSHHDSKWFFCGWYYHRGNRRHVTDGPHGPFPCMSAAIADALMRYGEGSTRHGR